MYKLHNDIVTSQPSSVIRLSDGASIPFDPDNRDAEEFALWLKLGNVPESAVEGETVSAEWIAETIAKLLPAEEQK
ncbi:hypothetical protein UFOVP146_35 [uncultured Caudovirales phage]|uniref:Uncharacterized protein n=1 Tax=uncultured Caudovirales phage TaxID=2100421 RepID=A0A6J7VKD4_9CAUD|nr:hypothetical protein UFOVP146_35 [uncultured Caudovirales phage]